MPTNSHGPPPQFRTERLSARCWQPGDAPLLKDAIDDTIPDLQRWTPWVIPDPNEVATLVERIERFRDQFAAGQSFIYGLFDAAGIRVLGQAGLYGRVGPNALEVGYWIRSSEAGQGLATEVTRALTDLAFRACGVARVELRCDVQHTASSAIARRLGFQLREVLKQEALEGHSTHELQVWQKLPDSYDLESAPPYAIATSGPV